MSNNTPTNSERRTKGDGSLYYNEAKGVWVSQYNSIDEETGKRIRKAVTGKTKSEAATKMKALLSGKTQAPAKKAKAPAAKQHNLHDFTLDYLNDFKKLTVTSRTYEWYINLAKHFRDGLANRAIESLTALDIQRFFNSLALEKSDKTTKEVHALLNQVLKHAVKQKIIPSNPMDDGVKRPRTQRAQKQGKALPRHVCKVILETLDSSPTYKPLVMTLLYTGIRVGELMALRWSNIDRDNMLLHIENAVTTQCEFDSTGKTVSRKVIVGDTKTAASQRVVPLEKELLDVLDEWHQHSKAVQKRAREQGNEDFIFPNQFGGLRSYQGFQKQFKRFLDENGLGEYGITFHKFRHTFATLLMEQGTNPRVVQELLGHRDIETTLGIYTTVSMGVKEKETGKLAAELAAIRNSTMNEADQWHNLIVVNG